MINNKRSSTFILVAVLCGAAFWSSYVYLAWHRLTFNQEPTTINVTVEPQTYFDKCMDVMRYVPNNADYDDARDWRFSWCVEQNNIKNNSGELE